MKYVSKFKRICDIVDFNDNVICTGSKEHAKKLGLFTRSVHIWLTNKKGEVMISKRSSNVKSYPNQITSSAGGHVEKGENYKIAALRELKEELGVKTSLKDMGRFDVITSKERSIHRLFIGKTGKKILLDPNEISSYYFAPIEVIKNDILLRPRKYAKPFHEAFKHYLRCNH